MGLLTQNLTFFIYASEYCHAKRGDGVVCEWGQGTSLSIAAVISFFFSMILSCQTPKSEPFVRALMEMERNEKNNDPCCYCFSNRYPQGDGVDQEEDEKHEDDIEKKETVNEDEPVPLYPNEITTTLDDLEKDESMDYFEPAPPYPREITTSSSLGPPVFYSSQGPPVFYDKYIAPVPSTSSFVNAEVYDADLFFDSKTL
jgi:hypothetical protein